MSDTSPVRGRFFLGLDGGQSHTTILIGDEKGQVLGAGLGGPTNYGGAKNTISKTEASIEEALRKALNESGLGRKTCFTAACCGMSGDIEGAHTLVSRCIDAEHLEVFTDAHIALWGATESLPGIVVIAGTGSIAWGENDTGKTARAGGWGYAFGDEGGAFDIVRQAMRAALKAEEGWGPETTLKDLLLQNSGSVTVNDLLHRFYAEQLPRDSIASLSLLVDRAASEQDETAITILSRAGLELAQLAQNVRKQLFAPDKRVTICFSGGVFCAYQVMDTFRIQLTKITNEPNVVIAPRRSPAHGALTRAYRAVRPGQA